MSYNNNDDDNENNNCNLKTIDKKDLKQVENFLILGSCISSFEKDINIKIGKKWTALINMKSKLSTPIRLLFSKSMLWAFSYMVLLHRHSQKSWLKS